MDTDKTITLADRWGPRDYEGFIVGAKHDTDWIPTVRAFMEHLIAIRASEHRIKLPCGHEFVINKDNPFPLFDVPCTCGDPDHYFVKYIIYPQADQSLRN